MPLDEHKIFYRLNYNDPYEGRERMGQPVSSRGGGGGGGGGGELTSQFFPPYNYESKTCNNHFYFQLGQKL